MEYIYKLRLEGYGIQAIADKLLADKIYCPTIYALKTGRKKPKKLSELLGRERQLDILFEKIYEDKIGGVLSEERFLNLSAKYEAEQAELTERMKSLQLEIDKETNKSMSTDMFIAKVRKYTRAKKLSQRMLSELIDHIEVYQAEKIGGVHVQKLKIHYNCVGSIEIPNILPLPQPEVLIQTRKGVAISYSQSPNIVNF